MSDTSGASEFLRNWGMAFPHLLFVVIIVCCDFSAFPTQGYRIIPDTD
jgi:hypothetical protein